MGRTFEYDRPKVLLSLDRILYRYRNSLQCEAVYILRQHDYVDGLYFPIAVASKSGLEIDHPFYSLFYDLRTFEPKARPVPGDHASLEEIANSLRIEAVLKLDKLPQTLFQHFLRLGNGGKYILVITGTGRVRKKLESEKERLSEELSNALRIVELFAIEESFQNLKTASETDSLTRIQRFFLDLVTDSVTHPMYFPFIFARLRVQNASVARTNNLMFLDQLRKLATKQEYLIRMSDAHDSYWDPFDEENPDTDEWVKMFSRNLSGDFVAVTEYRGLELVTYHRYNCTRENRNPTMPHRKQDATVTKWDALRDCLSRATPDYLANMSTQNADQLVIVVAWAKEHGKLFPVCVVDAANVVALNPALNPKAIKDSAFGGRLQWQLDCTPNVSEEKSEDAALLFKKTIVGYFGRIFGAQHEVEQAELEFSHHIRSLLYRAMVSLEPLALREAADPRILKAYHSAVSGFHFSEFIARLQYISGYQIAKDLLTDGHPAAQESERVSIERILLECLSSVFASYDRYRIPLSILEKRECAGNRRESRARIAELLVRIGSDECWQEQEFMEFLFRKFGVQMDLAVDPTVGKHTCRKYGETYFILFFVFRNLLSNALKHTGTPEQNSMRKIDVTLSSKPSELAWSLVLSVKNHPADRKLLQTDVRSLKQRGVILTERVVNQLTTAEHDLTVRCYHRNTAFEPDEIKRLQYDYSLPITQTFSLHMTRGK